MPALAALPQDELMPRYAELLYNGFWFSPEREALQAAIDSTQKFVTGTVRLKLYKVHFLLRVRPLDLSARLAGVNYRSIDSTQCFCHWRHAYEPFCHMLLLFSVLISTLRSISAQSLFLR